MAIVVDTGVLLGAADENDADHERSKAVLLAHRDQMLAPAGVLYETSWQIENMLGPEAEAAFLGLVATGSLAVVDLTTADWVRSIELIEMYKDLGLGVVDASIIAVAERLKIGTIATLNRRDFAVVRPKHCDSLELIP